MARRTRRKSCDRNQLICVIVALLLLIPTINSKPYLTSFNMDMHYGLLTLTFSETMMSKFFDATKIILQNTASYYNCTSSQTAPTCNISTGALRLPITSNSYSSVYNATSLYVSIGSADYATLSMASTMATESSNTWLVMPENTTVSSSDLSPSRAVYDGFAMQVRMKHWHTTLSNRRQPLQQLCLKKIILAGFHLHCRRSQASVLFLHSGHGQGLHEHNLWRGEARQDEQLLLQKHPC